MRTTLWGFTRTRRASSVMPGRGAQQALVLDPAKPPRGANVERAKLALLARPHPEAIAGT